MPAVVRQGDSCSGHGSFPPRQSTGGSPNVFIDGKPAHRVGDSWGSHTETSLPYSSHSSVASSGSSKVFVNGKPLCRVGDSIACGSKMSGGSSKVFCN